MPPWPTTDRPRLGDGSPGLRVVQRRFAVRFVAAIEWQPSRFGLQVGKPVQRARDSAVIECPSFLVASAQTGEVRRLIISHCQRPPPESLFCNRCMRQCRESVLGRASSMTGWLMMKRSISRAFPVGYRRAM